MLWKLWSISTAIFIGKVSWADNLVLSTIIDSQRHFDSTSLFRCWMTDGTSWKVWIKVIPIFCIIKSIKYVVLGCRHGYIPRSFWNYFHSLDIHRNRIVHMHLCHCYKNSAGLMLHMVLISLARRTLFDVVCLKCSKLRYIFMFQLCNN